MTGPTERSPQPGERWRPPGLLRPDARAQGGPGPSRSARRLFGRLPRGTIVAVCLLIIAVALGTVRLPLLVERPGDPVSVGAAVTVDGRTGDALDGDFAISTVRRSEATPGSLLVGWLDPGRSVRPSQEIVPPEEDFDDYRERQRLVFEGSARTAAAVALDAAGLSVEQRLAVSQVLDGAPAEGRLRAEDLLVEVDGQPVAAPEDLTGRLESGQTVELTIVRDGQSRSVTVTPERFTHAGEEHQGLGVLLQQRPELPVPVETDLDRISGPSAGLLLALTVYDLAVEDVEVARGRRIAGTGTLNVEGLVGPVGSIEAKVEGAVAADVEVFLVPEVNAEEARSAAEDRLDIIGVATFEEALEALVDDPDPETRSAGDAAHAVWRAGAPGCCYRVGSGAVSAGRVPARSRATPHREPGQGRKAAAISGSRRVPRSRRVGARPAVAAPRR